MTITITKKEVDEASIEFTRLVAADHRKEAVAIVEALAVKFMTQYHRDPDCFFDFNGEPASEAFQMLIANARKGCPKECEVSTNEIICFKLGDRVYGYNIDETPILFALAHSVPPGQIIIDHLNDHFRDNKSSPISKKEANHIGTSTWEESEEEVTTANEFEQFYTRFRSFCREQQIRSDY